MGTLALVGGGRRSELLQLFCDLITGLSDPVCLPCTLGGIENKVRYGRNKVRTLDLG